MTFLPWMGRAADSSVRNSSIHTCEKTAGRRIAAGSRIASHSTRIVELMAHAAQQRKGRVTYNRRPAPMKRSVDRILTTHTGSLIRPPKLLEFVKARQAGQAIDQSAYEVTLKDSVRDVVARQV